MRYEGEDWWSLRGYWTPFGKRFALKAPDGEVAFRGMTEELAAFVVNLANADELHQRQREASRSKAAKGS